MARTFSHRIFCSTAGALAIHLGVYGNFTRCFAADMPEVLSAGAQDNGTQDNGTRGDRLRIQRPYGPIPLDTQQWLAREPHAGTARLHSATKVADVTDASASIALEGDSLIDTGRSDGSLKIRIPLEGSLQNPAWSPDGKSIVFTRFRNGYNKGPADIYILDVKTNALRPVLTDGSDNVSQPGSTWNARTGKIAFSSDRDGHEEVWVASGHGGGKLQKLTSRPSHAAYEPSLAPDGRSLVFESRDLQNDEERGRITIFEIGGRGRYIDITGPDEDCRQPNWSARGDTILYQKQVDGQWDIWLYDINSQQHRSVTAGLPGDKTDASFSPDGRFIIYSGKAPETDEMSDGDTVLVLPVNGGQPTPLTRHPGYHGAPSWSPDGTSVLMEASTQAPDGTAGTELIITPVRRSVVQRLSD
jgi:TolB protein